VHGLNEGDRPVGHEDARVNGGLRLAAAGVCSAEETCCLQISEQGKRLNQKISTNKKNIGWESTGNWVLNLQSTRNQTASKKRVRHERDEPGRSSRRGLSRDRNLSIRGKYLSVPWGREGKNDFERIRLVEQDLGIVDC